MWTPFTKQHERIKKIAKKSKAPCDYQEMNLQSSSAQEREKNTNV